MDDDAWPRPLKLAELAHGMVARRFALDAAAREKIAAELGIDGLARLEAEVEATRWLDGARLRGRIRALVQQTCGVTLEPLESEIDHDFELKLLPAGSPNAPTEPEDTVLDPEAEDSPDIIERDQVDLAALVVELLAVEIDPFPRKPGVVFDPGPDEQPPSPFAVLKDFKPRGG